MFEKDFPGMHVRDCSRHSVYESRPIVPVGLYPPEELGFIKWCFDNNLLFRTDSRGLIPGGVDDEYQYSGEERCARSAEVSPEMVMRHPFLAPKALMGSLYRATQNLIGLPISDLRAVYYPPNYEDENILPGPSRVWHTDYRVHDTLSGRRLVPAGENRHVVTIALEFTELGVRVGDKSGLGTQSVSGNIEVPKSKILEVDKLSIPVDEQGDYDERSFFEDNPDAFLMIDGSEHPYSQYAGTSILRAPLNFKPSEPSVVALEDAEIGRVSDGCLHRGVGSGTRYGRLALAAHA